MAPIGASHWTIDIQFVIGANQLNGLAPIELITNWSSIEWQLNIQWIGVNWMTIGVNCQSIHWMTCYSIEVNWMFTFNWRQLMYNWIQWLLTGVNWRQLSFNWMSFFSIEWYWRQLMFNPRAFNWTSIDFNWIENHSIQWQLNSIEWYYSIKRCRSKYRSCIRSKAE